MSLGDPSPSPERDPQHHLSRGPGRPHLEVRTLDPIAIQVDLDNFDRFADVLNLCGISPSDDATEYLWKTLLQNQVPSVDTFNEAQGALGLNAELSLSARHELECRGHAVPELREYDDRVSVILSTRHRDGSELAALRNLSEESPGLDGLQLEIVATPLGEVPAIANIFWDETELSQGTPDWRRELVRGFYNHFNNRDLPETAPLAPGQAPKFHYMFVELDPMVVKVQRVFSDTSEKDRENSSSTKKTTPSHPLTLTLKNPPISALEKILASSGALQIQGQWVDDAMIRTILSHLNETLGSSSKLDIDKLKMCESALPCITFSREDFSDGASCPPRISSKVTMIDYTSRSGDLRLEFASNRESDDALVTFRWDNSTSRLNEKVWEQVRRIAKPFLAPSTS